MTDVDQPRTPSRSAAPLGAASPLGVVSLVTALVLVIVGSLRRALVAAVLLLMPGMMTKGDQLIWGIAAVLAVLALLALVTGLIALRSATGRRAGAIIGVTVGLTFIALLVGGEIENLVLFAGNGPIGI